MATSQELRALILSMAPRIYYPMTETSGTVLTDLGSLATNATLSGTYSLAADALIPGDSTKFLRLDGGAASASKGALAVPLTSVTISVIAQVNALTAHTQSDFFAIGAEGETTATNYQVSLHYLHSDYKLSSLHEYGSGSNVEIAHPVHALGRDTAGKSLFAFGKPSHFVLVRDAEAMTQCLYRNGVLLDKAVYANNPAGGTSCAITIGQNPSYTTGSKCSLAHLAIWERALTAQEVSGLALAAGYQDWPYEDSSLAVPASLNPAGLYGSASQISALTSPEAQKLLRIVSDPLVDPTVLAPEQAYKMN